MFKLRQLYRFLNVNNRDLIMLLYKYTLVLAKVHVKLAWLVRKPRACTMPRNGRWLFWWRHHAIDDKTYNNVSVIRQWMRRDHIIAIIAEDAEAEKKRRMNPRWKRYHYRYSSLLKYYNGKMLVSLSVMYAAHPRYHVRCVLRQSISTSHPFALSISRPPQSVDKTQ